MTGASICKRQSKSRCFGSYALCCGLVGSWHTKAVKRSGMVLDRAVALGRAALSNGALSHSFVGCRIECAAEIGLWQRLQSHWFATTSRSSSSSSTSQPKAYIYACAAHNTGYYQQGSSSGSISEEQHSPSVQQLQQQQPQQHLWLQHSSSSSSYTHPWSFSSIRHYADDARIGRHRRPPRFQHGPRSSSSSRQQREGFQAGSAAAAAQFQYVGRTAAACTATEKLREPFLMNSYDPWKDKSREALNPRQVITWWCGARGEGCC